MFYYKNAGILCATNPGKYLSISEFLLQTPESNLFIYLFSNLTNPLRKHLMKTLLSAGDKELRTILVTEEVDALITHLQKSVFYSNEQSLWVCMGVREQGCT